MSHTGEQKQRAKHTLRQDGRRRLRWRACLGLLGLITVLAIQGLILAPAQAAPFAYITNWGSGSVSVIDIATNLVLTSIRVATAPQGVAVHPSGTVVYVTHPSIDIVSVINTTTNTVSATIPVGDGPTGISVHPAGTHVYVANKFGNTVSVIDTATNKVVATVPVGSLPFGIAVHPAGTRVYVGNYNSSTVSVIDTASNRVIATVANAWGGTGIAIDPSGNFVYTAGGRVINTATNTIAASISVWGGARYSHRPVGYLRLRDSSIQ